MAVTVAAVACGSSGDAGSAGAADPNVTKGDPGDQPPGSDDPAVAAQLAERPWEVVSNKGETYLPDVFYADASQNEQIMPWALDGHVQIDRLVYPTLGNPNLYTKSDPNEQLLVVLRIEDAAYAHLGATLSPVAGSTLSRLDVANDPHTGFAFFLVPRGARDGNTNAADPISSGNGTGVYRIYPNDVLVNPIPADMPDVLKARKTVRFVFKQGAMAKVPPGLYDLRFEVRKDDALFQPQGSSQGVYEYQYNAVRVFDTEPEEYSVVNVTDTQVSVGDLYQSKTKQKLEQLVQYLGTTNDPNVTNAAFITFNGDLHNGGSPGSLRQRSVAHTYNDEAKTIVDTLKYLPLPIFLTVGNHDGYVSTGQVPSAVKALDTGLLDGLQSVIDEATPKAWPGYSWEKFQAFVDATAKADRLGGWHRDLFAGGFSQIAPGGKMAASFTEGYKEVPRDQRNMVLYDGVYQWRKTYGPLYYSHRFGKSFYVSLDSFELRQHRRSGWGMYTVNYGGGISDVQMAWLDRELLRSKVTGDDVIVLAHHDPRGGHKSLDPGYYFDQLEYSSVYQSAINYLIGKAVDPAVCKAPDWALPRSQEDSCLHDGLQEWMRPDAEFDCASDTRKPDGTCDPKTAPYFSGIELMQRLASNPQVRTLLLGHTHYNQLEVLQAGDDLLPGKLPIDGANAAKFASLEIENPMRGFAVQASAGARVDYDEHALPFALVAEKNARFGPLVDAALAGAKRTLDAPIGLGRELVVLRLVSNADLANQTYDGKSALGFAVLHLTKKTDARAYAAPQINQATFFVNTGANGFSNVRTIDVDRNARLAPHDKGNPIEQLYDW